VSEANLTSPGAPPRRVRWEYHRIVLTPAAPSPAPDDSPAVASAVAAAGADGWELVAVVPVERTEAEETLAYDDAGVAQETTRDTPRQALLYVFKRPAA
jgi:hypothetical protein